MGDGLFSQLTAMGREGTASSCPRGGPRWILGRTPLLKERSGTGTAATPSWEGMLICQRGEGHYGGTWIDWIDGPRQTLSFNRAKRQVLHFVTTTPGNPTGLGRSGWKAAWRKGTLVH